MGDKTTPESESGKEISETLPFPVAEGEGKVKGFEVGVTKLILVREGLIEAVKEGRPSMVQYIVDRAKNVSLQDQYGMTALHWAAAYGARPALRILVNSGKCDYLIRDNQGRYASELAFEQAQDYAVGQLLAKKEAQQAAAQGTTAWPKPD